MRICIFIPSLGGGGAEAATARIATALAARGHDVDLLTARTVDSPTHAALEGARLVRLDTRRTVTAIGPVRRHLRSTRPDVLLTVMDPANVAGLLAARWSGTGVPVVATYHTDVAASAKRSRHPYALIRSFVARWTIRRAARTVTVSDGARDSLRQVAPSHASRITRIYNPTVSPGLAALGAEEPARLPGVPSEDVVLAVGRLAPPKGFDLLLTAFARLDRAVASRHLVVLGEGPDRPALEQLAGELGIRERVHLAGHVANPYSFMARCRVFVLSSRWEGLPTVVVEAGSLGCRIVATDCESGPRELLAGRDEAVLVPVDDADALAGAIDDAVGMGRPARAGDWSEHTAEVNGRHYEELLAAVVAERVR